MKGDPSRSSPDAVERRLRGRRAELEQAILSRIQAIADPGVLADPAYAGGLRSALSVGLDYGLAALVEGARQPDLVPVQLLEQARRAARNRVTLDAVLRRYAAGYSLLVDTLIEESEAVGLGPSELRGALRSLAVRYDRVIAAVGEEHARAAEAEANGADRSRRGVLRLLLNGDFVDTSRFSYDFGGSHIGIVASGSESLRALLGELSDRLDRQLLCVQAEEEMVWAWLGSSRAVDKTDLEHVVSQRVPDDVALAMGEPVDGLSGWRLTHRQAAAALPVAQGRRGRVVRYGDVALLTATIRDDLLATSLKRLYLDPLRRERDRGAAFRQTLLAYFAAAGNVSSAAMALGVNRRTVSSRLAAIEKRLGRPLDAVCPEMEIALRLEEIDPLESRSS